MIHLVGMQDFPKNCQKTSEGKKCQFFGKFWVRTKWMIPSDHFI